MERNFKSTESKNIEIFVRILPSMDVSESSLKIADSKKDIYVRCIQDMKRDRILKSTSPIFWRFSTDGIFYNDSQEEVYKGVTKNLLNNVLEGVHCVLLSQGQIGTGKSFTIGGLRHSYEHRGIIVRLLSDMFEEKRIRKYSNAIEYRMNYVEIYKNQVKDLLASKNEEQRFNIRDASKITSASVKSEDKTLKTIFEGEARKEIGKGANYEASHRCTSVLTFHVENTSLITSGAVASHAKIHIVDMAGVDFFGKSSCPKSTEHLRNANLEKTQMEQFILALQNSQKSKTPYRQSNSNLIKFLGDAFHLGSLLRFIGHIRFTNEDLVLTLSTLRFSSNIKKLKPEKTKYNFGSESTQDANKLRVEVSGLREELELNEMLLNQEASTNLSPERVKRIEEDAIDFINGNLDDLTLLSVSQAQVLLKKFKEIFAKQQEDHKIALEAKSKEARDSAAKDLKGSALFVTKPSKTSATGSLNGKTRRKKSSTERSSKVLSEDSLAKVADDSKPKVGNLIETGITIGPTHPEIPFEYGPVMKWIEFCRYGEPPDRATVPCYRPAALQKTSNVNLKIAKRNDAFDYYLREDESAMTLKKDLEAMEEARKSGQSLTRDLVTKKQEIKIELEHKRVELHRQQNLRHMTGDEVHDVDGRVLIPELERRLFNTVMNMEKDFSEINYQLMKANEELEGLVEKEINARNKLEYGFQTFCDEIYDYVMDTPKEKDVSREAKENSLELEENIESKFTDLQKMMRLMIEKKPTEKKANWRNHVGINATK